MEQINLEDNQKELQSGDGKDGEGVFFHHQWKKIEKIARAVEGAVRVISYLAFGILLHRPSPAPTNVITPRLAA